MNHRYRQEFYPLFLFLALAGLRPASVPGWMARAAPWLALAGVAFAHVFLFAYVEATFGPADAVRVKMMLHAMGF
jgi:hypothetical protein